MVGRIVGWIFVAAGLGVAIRDAVTFLDTGAARLNPLGQLWYALDPGSLNLAQAAIERHVHPFLWDPVLFTVLRWPAAPVLLAAGFVLLAAFHRRKRRWRSGAFE